MSQEDEIHHMNATVSYFDRVAASYPGLGRWIDIQRGHGGMMVYIFDRRVSEIAPAYVFHLAAEIFEYMLKCEPHGEGRITPGFSMEEFAAFASIGEQPVGSRPEWSKPKEDQAAE